MIVWEYPREEWNIKGNKQYGNTKGKVLKKAICDLRNW